MVQTSQKRQLREAQKAILFRTPAAVKHSAQKETPKHTEIDITVTAEHVNANLRPNDAREASETIDIETSGALLQHKVVRKTCSNETHL